jgi:Spy/CpxP family protein refolding chaperone
MIQLVTISALAGGMAFAQTTSPSPNSPTARHNFIRQHIAQMEQQLNLTDAQKQQAQSIFQSARASAQPLRAQLKQNRQALAAAAKGGESDATIQQLATQQGNLMGQVVAVRTEAFKKFYAMMTPDQRAKADQMHQQFQQRMQNRFGQHPNG